MAYGEKTYSAVVANTTATVTVKPTTNRSWTVQQVSIEMADAPGGSKCTLRKNGTFVSLLVPNGDAAGGDPPVQLQPVDVLTITWTGATNGLVGKVLVIYDDGEAQP